ncbi:MAG TPA: hypothetical protein VEH00_00885 [Steroidobacteraceae bacterium]|nr:hypothetical protein [Steroidobacteraceae bacterium]
MTPAQSAATPAASATEANAAAKSEAAAQVAEDAQEKHFLSEGYRLEMHHGEKMFCRREDTLGSRLGSKNYCSTAEQLTATERAAQRAMDRSTWQQNNPSGK